jgi:uncharacterized membrane protein YphA (DoxX/SURF4 family)
MAPRLHTVPTRLATGAYILHEGLGKLRATPERAAGLHRPAASAYPFLADLPPERFTRALAIGEITVGSTLLLPFVPARLAGAALTLFSGGLVTMYLRTPAMHEAGSVWPTPAGIAVSKDVWMLAIGASLLLES